MDILRIIITSLASLIVLFLLTKLMGNKQLSQLSLFDYIVGITIGSIAADLAIELETPLNSVVALVVYGLAAVLISLLTNKSLVMRRLFAGRPILLLDGGKLYKKGFKKARIDLHEFLAIARVNGYYCINTLETAIMETNGSISFLPKEPYRPLTPKDMSLNPTQERMQWNLIMDGKLMDDNLDKAGVSARRLRDQLKALGFRSPKQIFLACMDASGVLTVYREE
ncbi:MAG: DUF421 domain-containing protein [Eubacteriales bacterium]|nr:DUF421 domain-containing protein [Eubacteriales bacterium]